MDTYALDMTQDVKNVTSRFEFPGIYFNAKLIGIDDVESPRGDKMCQESMVRLKLAVKLSKQHKQKILVNVSLAGIRIIDTKTQVVSCTHDISRISFISRDVTDNRAFGYVYGAADENHKFYAIKTEKAAEAIVLTLRDLFQAVYEKKKETGEVKHKHEEPAPRSSIRAQKENQHVNSTEDIGLITINVGQEKLVPTQHYQIVCPQCGSSVHSEMKVCEACGQECATVRGICCIADVCEGESEV